MKHARKTPSSTWRVQITGDKSSLHYLALRTAGGDPEVVEHDQGFWLSSSRFDSFAEARGVHAEAKHLIASLSGFARLELGSAAPLQVGNVERVDGQGVVHHHLIAEGFAIRVHTGIVTQSPMPMAG